MTDLEILECCQVILDFLTNPEDEWFDDDPLNIRMINTLKKFGFGDNHLSVINFFKEMEKKYPKESLLKQKRSVFLKQIIRELKLNILTK